MQKPEIVKPVAPRKNTLEPHHLPLFLNFTAQDCGAAIKTFNEDLRGHNPEATLLNITKSFKELPLAHGLEYQKMLGNAFRSSLGSKEDLNNYTKLLSSIITANTYQISKESRYPTTEHADNLFEFTSLTAELYQSRNLPKEFSEACKIAFTIAYKLANKLDTDHKTILNVIPKEILAEIINDESNIYSALDSLNPKMIQVLEESTNSFCFRNQVQPLMLSEEIPPLDSAAILVDDFPQACVLLKQLDHQQGKPDLRRALALAHMHGRFDSAQAYTFLEQPHSPLIHLLISEKLTAQKVVADSKHNKHFEIEATLSLIQSYPEGAQDPEWQILTSTVSDRSVLSDYKFAVLKFINSNFELLKNKDQFLTEQLVPHLALCLHDPEESSSTVKLTTFKLLNKISEQYLTEDSHRTLISAAILNLDSDEDPFKFKKELSLLFLEKSAALLGDYEINDSLLYNQLAEISPDLVKVYNEATPEGQKKLLTELQIVRATIESLNDIHQGVDQFPELTKEEYQATLQGFVHKIFNLTQQFDAHLTTYFYTLLQTSLPENGLLSDSSNGLN